MTFSWPRLAALVSLCAAASACGEPPPEDRLVGEGPEVLVALAVEARAPEADDTLAAARATFQTDKGGGVWYDALAAPADDPAMGLSVDGQARLHGWRWWVETDSLELGPGDRTRGVARPDVSVRSYEEPDTTGFLGRILGVFRGGDRPHLSERVTLLDASPADTASGTAVLLVEVADSVGVVGFRPVRADHEAAGDYRVQRVGGALAFAAAADVPSDSGAVPTGPIWTAVVASGGEPRSTSAAAASDPEAGREVAFRLGEVAFPTPGAVVVATGPTPEAAAATARRALAEADARRERRSARLAALVEGVGFETQDAATNAAFRWAAVSLDALVREDSSRVYLASGLPNAEPPSFPSAMWTLGAFLDLGQWERARNLLTTFGAEQRFDRRIDLLGRAPDLVPYGDDPVFATADGTPLFLDAAGDYVRTTGDRSLVSGGPNFWFKTVFALRGVYEPDSRNGSATDTLGFFVARNRRGTWLEADPERGGLRRRGAPAEAQGALYQALATATQFARIMGVSQRSSATWYADTSGVLVDQFRRRYVRDGLVVDRLETGRPVPEVRPGGLLALALLDGLPASERGALARALAERLVFPYGVASQVQTDTLFYPYLDAPAFYSPEAARTGGAVWTWLAGPVATLMAETGGEVPAAELMQNQTALLLDAGVVGAIPELVAGHPRTAEAAPETGGAPVQPWSLAGYLRGTMEGLVGARYASADTLVIAPRLPEAWGQTTVRMRMGDGAVTLALTGTADGLDAEVAPSGALPDGATLVVEAGGRRVPVALGRSQGDTLTVAREPFRVEVAGGGARLDGEEVPSAAVAASGADWSGFAFVEPELREEYPVMRAVENRRSLEPGQVRRDNSRAGVVLTQTDPDGDDWGATNTFTYPAGVEEGALDAIYLEVARDDSTTYLRGEFTALPRDPATLVVFALDTEEGGAREVGRGASYRFPEGEGYEYLVVVGEDFVVEDAAGREVGRLEGARLFDPATGSMTVAVPTFVLPTLPRGTSVTMLVGALDDDDVFRRVVEGEATDAAGGGRVNARSPNVYDVVVGTIR